MKFEFVSILNLLGGIGFCILGVLAVIRLFFFERIKVVWNRNASKKLEEIRGEIARNNADSTALNNALLNNFQKVQEKRIHAAETIWKVILENRNSMPEELGLLMRTKKFTELRELALQDAKDPNIQKLIKFDLVAFHNKLVDQTRNLEELRPFIGDQSFVYYELYTSILHMYVTAMVRGFRNGRLEFWMEEPRMASIIRGFITDGEHAVIRESESNTFTLFSMIAERKILAELRSNINGVNMSIDAGELLKSAVNMENS